MTKRSPVSAKQNIWFDAQQVDDSDLTLEQQYNDTVDSAIISDHIGTGVIPEILTQNILFDSLLFNGIMDGVVVNSQNQPVDNNFGNQLEISLTNSKATVRKAVKLCIIGLDFQSNLQYETFYFKTNEVQISKRHYTKILVLLFNDFLGDPNLSLNLGGRIIISESRPMTLSRDTIMVSQDIQPNLFFRDFFTDSGGTLLNLLQAALPFYNLDTLNIFTEVNDNKILAKGDVTTQIGQKFLALTNNIQKVSLLLSVQNTDVGQETELDWNGDLVISIYPLQSSIDSISDVAPNLKIDFSPSNIPVAQLSINYNSLLAQGVTLDSVPQPVDFIFSNSSIASGNVIVKDSYYALSIKRSGSANKCDILIATGADRITDSRITTFTGSLWVDLPEEDLWFRIWTDAAKISDGQSYESGHGISIDKTTIDSNSLAEVDYSFGGLPFYGNETFRAVVAAGTEESDVVPDQRTGNPVLSRKEFAPNVSLLNNIDLTNLEKTIDPLTVGAISDQNKKSIDLLTSSIASKLYSASLINDEILIRIVDDPTDPVRYDSLVSGLTTNLLLGYFVNAKIKPNAAEPSIFYRIADAKLSSMVVGDVNGDGIVDVADLDLLNKYIGFNFNIGLPQDSQITTDNITTTFKNGYNTLIVPFQDQVSVAFQVVDASDNVVDSGTDGVLVKHPTDPDLALFTSSSVNFGSIIGLNDYKLVLTNGTTPNLGGFTISSIDIDFDVLTIRKIHLTSETMSEMFRADINGDFEINDYDGYLLQSYINREVITSSNVNTFPAPATIPYTKIGTRFNLIKFKLETFNDRTDDYSSVTIGRSDVVHPAPDIFLADSTFEERAFYTSPVNFLIERQLAWDESLVVTNSRSKLVPSVFQTLTGYNKFPCNLQGIIDNIYPSKPEFDSGRTDYFVPDNLIIGEGGELKRPDGYFYKVDFEVGTIVLEIPNGLFDSETSINILSDFIATSESNVGVTALGFPAMRFADCSYVELDAIAKDQLRLSVSVQSFSPESNVVGQKNKVGVSIDYETGILKLNFSHLFQDVVLKTLSTKVQVNVFLKKGGFNNSPIFIDSNKVKNMLNLINVFPGTVEGGPSALVDLTEDVSGVLPILHGGTGLDGYGAAGTVLTSTGSGLSYEFISNIFFGSIGLSTGIPDAGRVPELDGYGKLDPSFLYKNPVYISAADGYHSTILTAANPIGAFTFRFDQFILQGIQDIKLEVILETENALSDGYVYLYDVTGSTFLNLNGLDFWLKTSNTTRTLLRSHDMSTYFHTGAIDHIYEIWLASELGGAGNAAICKMARIVITYSNPAASPPTSYSRNFVPSLT